MSDNSELLAALLAPIPGDNPGGSDLRYDPKYEACKDARREDVLIPGTEQPDRKVADWNRVIALATELLSKGTKDLQLAAWLSEALLRRNGVAGLTTGLAVLSGLLEQHWDHCFPELEDDDPELRAGPLEWIGTNPGMGVQNVVVASGGITMLQLNDARTVPSEAEMAAAPYEQRKLMEARREEAARYGKLMPEAAEEAVTATGKAFYKSLLGEIKASVEAVTALEKQGDARFGSAAPGYSKLRAALEELRLFAASTLAAKLELDPDPIEVVEESHTAEEPVVEGDGTLSVEPVSAKDASQRITVVARWLRHQSSADPGPYAMLRAYRWGELRSTAPDIEPRLLEAPPTASRSRLKGLLLDGRWAELLEQGETVMATPAGRGWLDLQRYALTACSQLGASHDAVAAVIRSELRALLRAVPGLPRMTLMDDTPTANEETREWLADALADETSEDTPHDDADAADSILSDGVEVLDAALVEDATTSAQGGLKVVQRRTMPTVRDAFELARKEVAQGRPNRAIEMLTEQLAKEVSPRARFVRQTQLAWVMVESGMFAVAEPILSRLIDTIDERRLEEWEAGPLVAQPLALAIRVIDKTDGDSGDRARYYVRICRLDPLQAIALARS